MKRTMIIFFILFFIVAKSDLEKKIYTEEISLRGITLSDALSILSKDTGITIVSEAKFKDILLDLDITEGKNLKEVLKIISITNKLRLVEISQDIYMFQGKEEIGKENNLLGTVTIENTKLKLEGVKITLLDSETEPVMSDANGRFIIKNVIPGTYIMKYEKKGFEIKGEFITVGEKNSKTNIALSKKYDKIIKTEDVKTKRIISNESIYQKEKERIVEKIILINMKADDVKEMVTSLMIDFYKDKNNKKKFKKKNTKNKEVTESEDDFLEDEKLEDEKLEFKVVSFPKLNTLIISGEESQVEIARNLILDMDKSLKQVRVSSQVLEVTDSIFEDLGFSWAYTKGGLQSLAKNNLSPLTPKTNVGILTESLPGGLGSTITLVKTFNNKNDFFNFSINLLEGTSDARISAIPSILVANGEEGKFHMTEETLTSYKTVSTSGEKEREINTEAVTGIAGIILEVTPIIKEDESILLIINVEVSNFTGDTSSITSKGGYNPKISRKLSTTITINNGDTIFIGGMKTTDILESINKVPVLGSIPFFGNLFKTKVFNSRVRDLYIKLKVDIVDSKTREEKFSLEGFELLEVKK
ncbi:MAG: hypothetical protein ACRC6K_06770 [Fusobacteriaceae bacterium]